MGSGSILKKSKIENHFRFTIYYFLYCLLVYTILVEFIALVNILPPHSAIKYQIVNINRYYKSEVKT